MTCDQEQALFLAFDLSALILRARRIEQDLGDGSFGRAAEQMQIAHDALRSRANA